MKANEIDSLKLLDGSAAFSSCGARVGCMASGGTLTTLSVLRSTRPHGKKTDT